MGILFVKDPASFVFGGLCMFEAEKNEIPSLKLTNLYKSHLKMDGWKTIPSFLGSPIFRGKLTVSLRKWAENLRS